MNTIDECTLFNLVTTFLHNYKLLAARKISWLSSDLVRV
jgi:hypothetical protein